MELRRAKIPYVLMGGMSFYDRKEVRDMLAYLKLLVNPPDEVSLLRIINVPARGIGQTTVTRLLEEAVAARQAAVGAAGRRRASWPAAARGSAGRRQASTPLDRAGTTRTAEDSSSLVDVAQEPDRRDRLPGRAARLYPDPDEQQARWAGVEEVVNAVGSYAAAGREAHAGRLPAGGRLGRHDDDQDKESKLERNAVALMTLHAAKGLEFPEVYMVGMEEGLLPHHRSIDDTEAADRRGAAAVLRGRDPGTAAADADAGPEPPQVGQAAADASPAASSTS